MPGALFVSCSYNFQNNHRVVKRDKFRLHHVFHGSLSHPQIADNAGILTFSCLHSHHYSRVQEDLWHKKDLTSWKFLTIVLLINLTLSGLQVRWKDRKIILNIHLIFYAFYGWVCWNLPYVSEVMINSWSLDFIRTIQ